MNVPVQVLEELKCSNCEDLLSCGPVKLKHDGSNICGRCSDLKLEEPVILNQPYNSLAKYCTFPCKYEAKGCIERVFFYRVKLHEEDCAFRTYYCPILESGSCDWIGPKKKLLEHAEESHPGHVLSGSRTKLEHDLSKSSFKNYLMTAFEVLFMVHVKVCLTTHTIYHSIRKFGIKQKYKINDHSFKFSVKIENKNGTLKRKRNIAPQGSMVLQENTAIGLKINAIMEALGSLNDVKFTITVEEYIKCFECTKIKNSSEIKFYAKLAWRTIFYCNNCWPTFNSCVNASQGCSWKGHDTKHEKYLCSYIKNCTECNENINEINSILTHMHLKHNLDYFKGKFYTLLKNEEKLITYSFKNQMYLFKYASDQKNYFIVYGDLKMKCTLIIRNAITKRTSYYFMKQYFDSLVGQFYLRLSLDDDTLKNFLNDSKFEIGLDVYCLE